jgi:hypothetical protein
MSDEGLFPAEHRALRELYALTRQLGGHWAKLDGKLDDPPAVLARGVEASRDLLAELAERTAAYGLHGVPAATGAGAWGSRLRGASDLFFERNQALRTAVLDVQHVTTLLAYLEAVSASAGTTDLAEFCHEWRGEMARVEERMRAGAVAVGKDPDYAIEPLDPSMFGRAAHSAQYWFGTFGEWFDRRSAERGPD